MSNKYSWEEILNTIRTELDIRVMLEEVMNKKLYHEEAVKNQHLINGEVDMGIDYSKDNLNSIVCPFHETTNTGAGKVMIDSNTFSCFSGKCDHMENKYNVIDLYLILRYNLTPDLLRTAAQGHEFKEAVKDLAKMIDIDFQFEGRKLSPEEKKAQRLGQLLEDATAIYHDALKTHKYANKAKTYMLETRGFQYGAVPFDELVDTYHLGYAPSLFSWDWLCTRLKRKKYTEAEILEAGVGFRYQKKDKETKEKIGEVKLVDFFTDGVIMPYFTRKKVSNLYSRALNPTSDDWRHLRLAGSVDQPINWDEVKRFKEIIVVEGEFSWLALIAMGFKNILGNRGTGGLHPNHIKMLKTEYLKSNKKNCVTIYLCFDPDAPGFAATAKTGKALTEAGFDVRIIRLPSWSETNKQTGELKVKGDPNDLLVNFKTEAPSVFEKCKDEAISYEAFMILHHFNTEKPKTAVEKRAAFKSVREFIEDVPKEELMFILQEVEQLLDLSPREANWLYQTWSQSDNKEETEEPVSLDQKKNPWILVTDEKTVEDYYKGNLQLTNVINASPQVIINQLKDYPRINNIMFDSDYPAEKRTLFFNEFSTYKYYELSSEVKQNTDINRQFLFEYAKKINSDPNKVG